MILIAAVAKKADPKPVEGKKKEPIAAKVKDEFGFDDLSSDDDWDTSPVKVKEKTDVPKIVDKKTDEPKLSEVKKPEPKEIFDEFGFDDLSDDDDDWDTSPVKPKAKEEVPKPVVEEIEEPKPADTKTEEPTTSEVKKPKPKEIDDEFGFDDLSSSDDDWDTSPLKKDSKKDAPEPIKAKLDAPKPAEVKIADRTEDVDEFGFDDIPSDEDLDSILSKTPEKKAMENPVKKVAKTGLQAQRMTHHS